MNANGEMLQLGLHHFDATNGLDFDLEEDRTFEMEYEVSLESGFALPCLCL